MKFERDLELESEENRRRKEKQEYNGECLKNQITLDKAKRMVEEEQRKAMATNDPKEREEILRKLKEKIRKIVKCQRCQRIISSRIIEV